VTSEPSAPSAQLADDRIRILVVDDEQEICALLNDVLTNEGYAVEVCTDSMQALDLINSTEFDGVITDLKMPGADGLTVARAVKARCPETATIVVTAYASLQTAIGALRTGVDDYICKPFDIDLITEVVRKAVSVRLAEKRNRFLLEQLRQSNSRLQQHEKKLADRVIRTSRNLMTSNSRLSRRVGELSMLNDISKMLANELNLDGLLTLSLKIVKEKMGVRGGIVMLSDSAVSTLVVKASLGFDKVSVGESLPVGKGIAGAVAAQRAPLLIEEIHGAENLHPADFEVDGFTSVLGVPLMVKETLVGVLLVYDKITHDKFTGEDTHLLVTIGSQMAIAIENARLYNVLQDSTLRTVQALATSLEAKDNYTSGHSARVTHYSLLLAERIGLGEKLLRNLRYASQLHDIGKIGITERILNKPDKLTDWEMAAIKDHPVIGERIIQGLDFLDEVRDIIRHHHERWDGAGYPDGLPSEDIPLLARIMAVADSYDAMTTARPYRGALSRESAISELVKNSGSQFDPRLVTEFLEVLKQEDFLSSDTEELTTLL
jgi:putative nucleotidyltransferase with HDIG domain